jgi:hypothetical protein
MKTIGLIGGMGWESTVPYYRTINETVRERLGGLHSAKAVCCTAWISAPSNTCSGRAAARCAHPARSQGSTVTLTRAVPLMAMRLAAARERSMIRPPR